MTRTSSISGTFVKRQRSPVRVAAASILRAAFLLPLIRTRPRSWTPPVTRKACFSTGCSWYSQWNGRSDVKRSAARTRAFSVPPLGNADAQQRTLQRRPRSGEVGRLFETFGQGPLGLASGFHRLFDVDLGRHVGRLGHHHDLVRPDLQEATG